MCRYHRWQIEKHFNVLEFVKCSEVQYYKFFEDDQFEMSRRKRVFKSQMAYSKKKFLHFKKLSEKLVEDLEIVLDVSDQKVLKYEFPTDTFPNDHKHETKKGKKVQKSKRNLLALTKRTSSGYINVNALNNILKMPSETAPPDSSPVKTKNIDRRLSSVSGLMFEA